MGEALPVRICVVARGKADTFAISGQGHTERAPWQGANVELPGAVAVRGRYQDYMQPTNRVCVSSGRLSGIGVHHRADKCSLVIVLCQQGREGVHPLRSIYRGTGVCARAQTKSRATEKCHVLLNTVALPS